MVSLILSPALPLDGVMDNQDSEDFAVHELFVSNVIIVLLAFEFIEYTDCELLLINADSLEQEHSSITIDKTENK